jgi:hypothetical protein
VVNAAAASSKNHWQIWEIMVELPKLKTQTWQKDAKGTCYFHLLSSTFKALHVCFAGFCDFCATSCDHIALWNSIYTPLMPRNFCQRTSTELRRFPKPEA